MALFIHKENQTLLWETIHKSPYWNHFESIMGENTPLWFRNIISMFYDKIWDTRHNTQITVDELKHWNRETILFCVQDMKKCLGVDVISPTTVQNNENIQPVSPTSTAAFDMSSRLAMYDRPPDIGHSNNEILMTPQTVLPSNVGNTSSIPTYAQLQAQYDVTEQKEFMAKKAAAQFEAFQRSYNNELIAPKPDTIDFSIPLNEPKIKNMEELMEQQMKHREMEDKLYTPPVGVLSPQTVSSNI